MNVKIRQAKVADTKLIVKLSWQTMLETFDKDNAPGVVEAYLEENITEEIIENEISNLNSSFFITEKDSLPVGFFKLRKDNYHENELAGENSIELQRIYVLEAEKGKKIGSLQMDYSINLARKEGFEILWLGVWEKNLKAIEFYEKKGFQKFNTHPFPFGDEIQTDVMMKKNI